MIDTVTLGSTTEEACDDQRSPLAALRRFARTAAANKPVEKCELCSLRLPAEHRHLVDLRTRRLVCCCDACGMLFSGRQSPTYRRVPRTIQFLPEFQLSDMEWESLLIPINLAFFYRSVGFSPPPNDVDAPSHEEGGLKPTLRPGKIVAVYPSPAGPIESLLGLDAWQAIAADNPRLSELQPEVEALLANRLSGQHLYYIVPIDEAYRLNGLVRRHWRGLSGGSEVWDHVARFFQRLREKACLT